jgi:hypothetical protein
MFGFGGSGSSQQMSSGPTVGAGVGSAQLDAAVQEVRVAQPPWQL